MRAHQSTSPEPVQIAELLGLPRPGSFDDIKLVDSMRHGFPARSAERVVRSMDPGGARMSAYDLVAKSTLHRAIEADKPLSTDASETLWQVARVFIEARRQYRDTEEALAFLFRPHPLLDGRRPFDLARETAAGADLVLRVLAQAEAGLPI